MELVPYRRSSSDILSPFHHMKTQWKVCHARRRSSPDHAGTMISDFQPPERWEISFYCVYATQSGTLLQQPKQTKTQRYIFPLWFQKDIRQPINPKLSAYGRLQFPPQATSECLFYICVSKKIHSGDFPKTKKVFSKDELMTPPLEEEKIDGNL